MAANDASSESTLRIEPKANGVSVCQQLQETSSLNVTYTPSPTDPKDTRLYAVAPKVECGRVYLVDGDWNEEFIDEVCGFPATTNTSTSSAMPSTTSWTKEALRFPSTSIPC